MAGRSERQAGGANRLAGRAAEPLHRRALAITEKSDPLIETLDRPKFAFTKSPTSRRHPLPTACRGQCTVYLERAILRAARG